MAWKMVRGNPARLSWWMRFTDAHAEVIGGEGSSISEPEIRQQLAKVSDTQSSAIESYYYVTRTHSGEPDPSKVLPLADASPPAPYANFVLAEGALEKNDWRTAAMRFEREGSSSSDVDETCLRRALGERMYHDDWAAVRARINDPRWAAVVDASLRLDLAVHDRDVFRVLLWVWPAGYVRTTAWPVALALIAGALWFWIATRLGRIHDGVQGRISLYALSFALGVLSIYPTIILGTIEGELGFVEVGQHVPDFIYNVFGIGLREEACKAILFLPLLWILLRRGSRIEAMTCGALVGLGFAAEENIGYFEHGADALSRFLSANFLHMGLTALVALSMFDTLRKRATRYDTFKVVFPVAVAVHGAYDFCLGVTDVAFSSLFSIVLLIVIARRFLRQLLIASSREDERDVLNLFVGAMAAITGAAYIYGTTLVGPLEALRLIALGAAGVAAMIVMFVRELSPR